MDLQELIDAMTEVAASLELPLDLGTTLDRLTRSAADAIPGIDHVSISVTSKDGRIHTLNPHLLDSGRSRRTPRLTIVPVGSSAMISPPPGGVDGPVLTSAHLPCRAHESAPRLVEDVVAR